jgi:hypothetical protein
MKSIIALLLGLSAISFADDDGEQFSWDSNEASSQSYAGLVIQVYQPDDEALVITLATHDDAASVYCLNFAKIFEAIYDDDTCREDCTYEIISGTEVDLADANCTVTEVSSTQFTAVCDNVNGAVLTLDFEFGQDDDGTYGLEYTIDLSGYALSEGDVKFVMEQSVKDCSIQYEDSGDSGDQSNDESNDESNESYETTDAPDDDDDDDTTDEPRRRLQDEIVDEVDSQVDDDVLEEDSISDSEEEEAGISSDDSREYDNGLAQFIISGDANDVCLDSESESTEVEYYMVQQPQESLQIVFARFECSLQVDPWFKIDKSKVDESNLNQEEDGANAIQNIAVIVFISVFLFLL